MTLSTATEPSSSSPAIRRPSTAEVSTAEAVTAIDPVLAAQRRSAELERQITVDPSRFRILTGDRPTGPLHLGHYVATVANRVRLQAAGVEIFIVIADYQVITDRSGLDEVQSNVRELILDYLAAGICPRDPAGSVIGSGIDSGPGATIFTHSAVPALNQLMLPFLSLVSVAELERNPTVKAEAEASGGRALSGLLLTYPVHQAADILFCAANLVPVGKDQLPHLETTRLIARRFNDRYGDGQAVFPQPEALLSSTPLLLGTDGKKMSKSASNAIALRASDDETARLIRSARTDGERRISYEPERRPEIASLLLAAAHCQGRTPQAIAAEIGDGGAVGLKRVVTESINEHLRPLRQRRRELAADNGYLRAVLAAGNAHANEVANETLDRVRELMKMSY